jgi:tetratricopeptide (TPR) repeat protein
MAGEQRDIAAMTAKARLLLGTDPQGAAEMARQVMTATPDAIEPRFIRAAALRRCGDARGALDLLGPLAAANPGAWGLHYEQGMALAALGESEAAAGALERATRANPRSPLAWHALGDQRALLGSPAPDAPALPGGVEDPGLAVLAARLFDGDDMAGGDLRARFGLDLNDPAAMRLLADVGLRIERHAAVAALLRRALAIAPGFAPARLHLALALHLLDENEAALAAVDPLVDAHPRAETPLALRAAIRMKLGLEQAASEDFAAALALAPNDAALWHGRGHALRALGLQAAAIEAYRQAIAQRPTFGEAWWSLANLKTWRFADGDVTRMEAALADKALSPFDRSHLHFALGKALEDERDYAGSFGHYHRANALRRATAPHDAAAHSAFVQRTIATFGEDMVARSGVGLGAPDPIFVLGMPRSGSTLVEQILAGHSAVEAASELPYLTAIARELAGDGAYPERLAALDDEGFARLGAAYLRRAGVHRPEGRPRFVDKFPGNFLHVGLIHLILPRARIIDVRRDARACCWSLFKQSFARGQAYSYDLADLGRYYSDYVDLMQHFDQVLPGRVLRLSYEALVVDTETETRRMLDHLGLDFEPACLDFFAATRVVRTPSSEQVRQPIFRDGLDQWRHFSPWLDPLIAALRHPPSSADTTGQ